jgi:hypothetical protein
LRLLLGGRGERREEDTMGHMNQIILDAETRNRERVSIRNKNIDPITRR